MKFEVITASRAKRPTDYLLNCEIVNKPNGWNDVTYYVDLSLGEILELSKKAYNGVIIENQDDYPLLVIYDDWWE